MGVKSTKINIMRKITQEVRSGIGVRSGMIDVCVEKLNSLKA